MPGRYADLHSQDVNAGPGDARPTGMQILEDEDRLDGSLKGKVVVITGCSSGIGIPTVEAMVAAGALVYGGVRSLDRGKKALATVLNNPETRDKLHLLDLDLTSLASVRAFADAIKEKETKINILINNAGVMAIQTRELTQDGFEMQIGTNHLSHFLLFQCLRDLLIAGAKASSDFATRVVNVSSSAHRASPVHLDDINLEGEGKYAPLIGYGNSKTANIWMANQIERLYGAEGVHGYSIHPGVIETGLQRHVPAQKAQSFMQLPGIAKLSKSPEQGCATTIWAATARELEGKGGVYCEDCQVAEPMVVDPPPANPMVAPGHATWAYNPEGEEKLWDISSNLVGQIKM